MANGCLTWPAAFEILKPLATPDYIGGAWPELRVQKHRALYELAHKPLRAGAVVELGTFRGLGAITLALATDRPVYTIDHNKSHVDATGYAYAVADHQVALQNIARVNLKVEAISRDVRQAARDWTEPVSLLFWDLGEKDRLSEDLAAWAPHLTPGGLVVIKDNENNDFGHEVMYQLGLAPIFSYPAGCIYVGVKRQQAVWIVSAESGQYYEEALQSARRVGYWMPFLERTIIVPQARRHPDHWYIEQTRLLLEALADLPKFSEVLLLDSDAMLMEPVPELFNLLAKFDLGFAHAPGQRTAKTVNRLPASFPEFNIGVVVMRNNELVRQLWKDVYRNQIRHIDVYGDNDQSPLRETLWQGTGATWTVFPWEYNCRFQFGTFLAQRVKILHGRTAGNYDAIKQSIDEREGVATPMGGTMRTWRP